MSDNLSSRQKVIEGMFAPVYYNSCEAGCPLGLITVRDTPDVLCDLIKDAFNMNLEDAFLDGSRYPPHDFLGKKVKITIEVFDFSNDTVTKEES